MPTRDNAAATCSCGAKWGDRRALESGDDGIADGGRTLLMLAMPKIVRHWALGHRLTGHGETARIVIAREAANLVT